MAITNKWWNENSLSGLGIRSMYDPHRHVMKFAHDYENFGQKLRTIVEVDAYLIEHERFDESDLLRLFDQTVMKDPDYIHEGPSNEDLRNPAIRHAWDEFQLVYRLAGGRQ